MIDWPIKQQVLGWFIKTLLSNRLSADAPWLIIYLYNNVLLQQCSQYTVLHPAVAQFVTRLCIDIYREQGSDLDTLQADVECDKSVPIPN